MNKVQLGDVHRRKQETLICYTLHLLQNRKIKVTDEREGEIGRRRRRRRRDTLTPPASPKIDLCTAGGGLSGLLKGFKSHQDGEIVLSV